MPGKKLIESLWLEQICIVILNGFQLKHLDALDKITKADIEEIVMIKVRRYARIVQFKSWEQLRMSWERERERERERDLELSYSVLILINAVINDYEI